MTKKIIFAVMLVMTAFAAKAQEAGIILATLQHGESMTEFYGKDGLKNAVAAAVSGDVITLSAGTFNTTTIEKKLTIIGAGYVDDAEHNRKSTTFTSSFTINLPEGEEDFMLEGINATSSVYVSGSCVGMQIKRCQLSSLTIQVPSTNILLTQSRIGTLYLSGISNMAYIKNCIISSISGSNKDTETGVIENCVMLGSPYYLRSFVVKNSIWCQGYTYGGLGSNANSELTAYYNNIYDSYYSIKSSCVQQNNTGINESSSSDFKAKVFEGTYTSYDNGDFRLNSEMKALSGTDGTEIGIYGGTDSFTDVPSNPQITSKTVATQADASGKLSVHFTVEAQN